MTTEEKLRIIQTWTAEFTIKPQPDGSVVAKTILNGFNDSPYTLIFSSMNECIDVRFAMVAVRVYDLCQHIDSLKWDKSII